MNSNNKVDELIISSDKLIDFSKIITDIYSNNNINKIIEDIEHVVKKCSNNYYDALVIPNMNWFVCSMYMEGKKTIISCFRVGIINGYKCLSHLCVLPEYRKEGLATYMLCKFHKFYNEQEYRNIPIFLFCEKNNTAALRLYYNLKYEKIQESDNLILYKMNTKNTC